jgi:hypothetical protein
MSANTRIEFVLEGDTGGFTKRYVGAGVCVLNPDTRIFSLFEGVPGLLQHTQSELVSTG